MNQAANQAKKPRLKRVNDPTDFAGLYLPGYSLYQTYAISSPKAENLCERLYDFVSGKVQTRSLGDAKAQLIIYQDEIHRKDQRKYIVVTRDTVRDTRATVFIRFLEYGDNLYLGIDTYVLGGLNSFLFNLTFFITIVLPLGTFPIAYDYFKNESGIEAAQSFLFSFLFLFSIVFLASWWNFINYFLKCGSINLALRQAFPGGLNSGSFNLDDIIMFVKSTLHISTRAIRIIFKEEGLPVESLDAFVQNINNINNISTSGGGMYLYNSAIGANNSVNVKPGN